MISEVRTPVTRPTQNARLFLTRETPQLLDQVDELVTRHFASDIKNRPVYRFRNSKNLIPGLCRVALDHKGQVQGSIRVYKACLQGRGGSSFPGLLLGPLTVSPSFRGHGLARQLIEFALGEARARGLGPIFVVGDPGIYRKHGFCNATSLNIKLDGQDDLRRFLVAEVEPGQLNHQSKTCVLVPVE